MNKKIVNSSLYSSITAEQATLSIVPIIQFEYERNMFNNCGKVVGLVRSLLIID